MGQLKVEIELENPTDRELYRLRYIKKIRSARPKSMPWLTAGRPCWSFLRM